MTVQHWETVKELLQQALQLEPAQRAAFLDEACPSDPSLRAEVESLLLADEAVRSSFLQSKTLVADRHRNGAISALEAGQVFEQRFQLVRKVGEGGMGQVWLAEQISPVRRQVALKLIKAGMYDETVLQRFRAERQSLAIMDHPAIAKVFDAGATPQGQPYFVMEYVPGLSITEYCDRKKLKIRDRLRLFIQACEGVQHAHQKAIIHRDLKPANILVVEVDGKPTLRIIDFGLAKATTPQVADETLFTQLGHLVGTPGYMSPEQADPNVRDIDTRTDVYSLGAILYVLLTGAQPFDTKQWKHQPLYELLRKLREEDPPNPSTRVSSDRDTSSASAEVRGTGPRQLAGLLRGDLDWITMKALEKDRARRYGSASEFAADIKRYLNHEAVLAVPPSLAYRTRKFARRYRAPLMTASVFALMLVVAAVVSIREGIRAKREAAIADAVNEFLQNDLLAQAGASTQAGPNAKPDPHLEVRTALDRAAEHIEGKFTKQPDVEASIRDTIGWTYADLGLYPEARKQLERALELRRRLLGSQDAKTLKSMSRLARVVYLQGKYAEAEVLESETLQAQRRVLGPKHPDTLTSMQSLGSLYDDEGKYGQAEALLTQTLEIKKRVLGPEHPETLKCMNELAIVYEDEDKYAQAEELDTQTLEIRNRVLGPEHPDTLSSVSNLAIVDRLEHKYALAEELNARALEIKRRVLGPEHPDTLKSMGNLANVYTYEGKDAQAEELFNQTLEIQKRVLGPEHPDTLRTMANLAGVYAHEGKYAQAEGLFEQTLEIFKRVLGPEHPVTAQILYSLAGVAARRGDKDRAIARLSQSVDHGLPASLDLGIGKDTDLALLQGDPRFAALVAHAKQVAETNQMAAAQKQQGK
jgi:non-specific serine/threonine protein kinase/serine/threonine-protein kinase